MAKWQKESGFRKFLRTRTALVLLLVAAFFLLRSLWPLFQKSRAIVADRRQVEQELRLLREREANLASEIASLETESGLEREIREKFPVLKSGERVIVLMATGTAESAPTTTRSWWERLWPRERD